MNFNILYRNTTPILLSCLIHIISKYFIFEILIILSIKYKLFIIVFTLPICCIYILLIISKLIITITQKKL